MKKYFILSAVAALALASCTSDEYVGTEMPAGSDVISFNGGTGVVSRAAKTGADAATALNNSFVVYGFKTTSSTPQKVYDHYTVNYVDGTALSTPSNSAGWEYVNQNLNMLSKLPSGAAQEIKYWDFAANQYDFIAFSTGAATQVAADADPIAANSVAVSAITNTPSYTIKGAVADIAKVYIADRVTAKNNETGKIDNRLIAYKDAVQFNFRSLAAKVRIGLYEIIPGYSVKDVKFYAADAAESTTTPSLFASAANIPGGTGTMTVTFPTTDKANTDYNKAHAAFTDGTNTKDVTFSALTYTTAESKEAAGSIYLGRTSAAATYAGNATATDHAYITVLPATAGALTLKVDYTLVSKDGSGEEIKVTGATATVPAAYCTWQPNYAYTYLFKITDKTSGNIGDDPAGLYPITFDAIVTETEDGVQETITAVEPTCITTYQKGKVVTENDEYKAGKIYVAVEGTPTMTEGTNYNLYTATITAGALQGITEESVANCLANAKTYTAVDDNSTMTAGTTYYTSADGEGKFTPTADDIATYQADDTHTYYTAAAVGAAGPWTVKDAAGKTLTLTLANGAVEPATKIPAADSPTGDDLTINCAVIIATAPNTYVFEYINSGVKTYKVIKVVE